MFTDMEGCESSLVHNSFQSFLWEYNQTLELYKSDDSE